jgi:hypothetical protein
MRGAGLHNSAPCRDASSSRYPAVTLNLLFKITLTLMLPFLCGAAAAVWTLSDQKNFTSSPKPRKSKSNTLSIVTRQGKKRLCAVFHRADHHGAGQTPAIPREPPAVCENKSFFEVMPAGDAFLAVRCSHKSAPWLQAHLFPPCQSICFTVPPRRHSCSSTVH